jgi:hypothetical protein
MSITSSVNASRTVDMIALLSSMEEKGMPDEKKNVIAIDLYPYYMLMDRDRLMRKRVTPRMNVVGNAFHATEETHLFHSLDF